MPKIDPTLEELRKTYKELLDRVEKLEDKLGDWPKRKIPPPHVNPSNCPVCGLYFKDAMGYVCYNTNCPTFTRTTC